MRGGESPHMEGPFSRPQETESRGWLPLAIGAGVIIVVLAVVFLLSRNAPRPTGPAPEDAYVSNIRVTDVHLSEAKNFVGSGVIYIEGNIANVGVKKVTGANVEAVFRNSLGEVVQRETQPLTLLQEMPGYTDSVTLAKNPLTPNMKHEFRLTFEHISADWNQGFPELRFVKIDTE